jgi:hypothetical protein
MYNVHGALTFKLLNKLYYIFVIFLYFIVAIMIRKKKKGKLKFKTREWI